MLQFDSKQYSQIGAWLKGIVEKNGLDVSIKKPKSSYMRIFNSTISFSYIISNKEDTEDVTYLYIQEDQQWNNLNLKLKNYGKNRNELCREKTNGSEIEKIIIDMYNQLKQDIDFSISTDENPFASITGETAFGQTFDF